MISVSQKLRVLSRFRVVNKCHQSHPHGTGKEIAMQRDPPKWKMKIQPKWSEKVGSRWPSKRTTNVRQRCKDRWAHSLIRSKKNKTDNAGHRAVQVPVLETETSYIRVQDQAPLLSQKCRFSHNSTLTQTPLPYIAHGFISTATLLASNSRGLRRRWGGTCPQT
jgi:hypothetical protein